MDENYNEVIDEVDDQIDEGNEIREGQLESYDTLSPQAKEQQNLYTWFWNVVKLDKPMRVVRVGNLNNTEIGDMNITVRDALNLHQLGKTFHHPTFGNYFAHLGKIITTTSMSRKGWFMDLSISQKKVRERSRHGMTSSGEKRSWMKGIFTRKDITPQQDLV